ncbi:MAG TPA: amidohydrolase family protein [Stellaceae bacterium]|nr:amidohydrolase family protein [Stellaceae bacterium]
MLFTCLPPGTQIEGRFPGPVHARGKWYTIDIHCHVHLDKADEMVKPFWDAERDATMKFANERTRKVQAEQVARTQIQLTSVEQRLKDMDIMGIDMQAFSPAPVQMFYWTDPELGLATAQAVNDNIAGIVARHPDRFVGLGTIPFQAPELAIRELERITGSLGMRGIEISSNVDGTDFSDPRFRPIFQRCEELGVVLFMHPSGFTDGRRFGDHYFSNVIGIPLESTIAVHHLIFGGVLDAYPGLKIVVAHGGGYLPAYSGRIDHGAAARPDCCEHLKEDPTTYLKRLYFDTMVFTHHQLEYLVRQYGPEHVLMGTDYPYDMGEIDPIGFVERAPHLSDAERRQIFGGNAARLLGVEVPARLR